MKKTLFTILLCLTVCAAPGSSSADQQPEMIVEKMAVKLTRGVTNFFTCVGELPKQTILTVRELGPVGYAVGPLKGLGMTLYRGFTGVTEAVFFMVPQPGYFDPMIDPPYVWQGWEPKREITTLPAEEPAK